MNNITQIIVFLLSKDGRGERKGNKKESPTLEHAHTFSKCLLRPRSISSSLNSS